MAYLIPNLAIPISLIFVGEIMILLGDLRAGLIFHGFNLIYLIFSVAFSRDRVFQVLALAPIFRLTNIFMPVMFDLTLYTYAAIYAVMLIPIYLIIKSKEFSREEIGLDGINLRRYLPLAFILGLLLGWIEYQLIRPEVLTLDFSPASILITLLMVAIPAGVIEEFIFRSSIQTALEGRVGRREGLVVASLIFGIMYSGYGLVQEIILVFFAGLTLGLLFQKSRSLAVTALAHTMINVSLFIIMPIYPSMLPPAIMLGLLVISLEIFRYLANRGFHSVY